MWQQQTEEGAEWAATRTQQIIKAHLAQEAVLNRLRDGSSLELPISAAQLCRQEPTLSAEGEEVTAILMHAWQFYPRATCPPWARH